MTKIETVAALFETVTNGTEAAAVAAAKEIVAIKKTSKTSFEKLGLTEANANLVQETSEKTVIVRERGAAKATPAGVHKLSKLPKGNDVKGKVWASVTVIMPDGVSYAGRVETKRGAFVYFTDADGQGYRADVNRFKTETGDFDLRSKD